MTRNLPITLKFFSDSGEGGLWYRLKDQYKEKRKPSKEQRKRKEVSNNSNTQQYAAFNQCATQQETAIEEFTPNSKIKITVS